MERPGVFDIADIIVSNETNLPGLRPGYVGIGSDISEKQMKTSKFSYNATVSRCIEVTGEIRILQVRLDQPGFKFKAGQYTMLGLLQDEPRIPERSPRIMVLSRVAIR